MNSYFRNKFIKDLKEGRVKHVGEDEKGKPIYRDMR